jgi:predicted DNA-binding transcriptional regulator YafY
MNRTDRLYALVEELRAVAPQTRTARALAATFEVSTRTVERDLAALQQAGVPIYADVGRRGGYTIDASHTLPPVNFTPAEAVAVALALADHQSPFALAGRRARQKLLAAMADDDAEAARRLGERIKRFTRNPVGSDDHQPSPSAVTEAITAGQTVRLRYIDRRGSTTEREIEPVGIVEVDRVWYVSAWCRLRDDVRVFRIDRIASATATGQPAPPRDPEVWIEGLPNLFHKPEVW